MRSIGPTTTRELAHPAREAGTAFVPLMGVELADVLCENFKRTVANDICVTFGKLKLQIPETGYRIHYRKVRVRVHRYMDQTLAIFHGPRKLATFAADGTSLEPTIEEAARASQTQALSAVKTDHDLASRLQMQLHRARLALGPDQILKSIALPGTRPLQRLSIKHRSLQNPNDLKRLRRISHECPPELREERNFLPRPITERRSHHLLHATTIDIIAPGAGGGIAVAEVAGGSVILREVY